MDSSSVLVELACSRLRKLLSAYPRYHGDFQRWVSARERAKQQGRAAEAIDLMDRRDGSG